MADRTQSGDGAKEQPPLVVDCSTCEAQLTDALDGLLSEREQAAFDAHLLHCQSCAKLVGDAKRGAAWLEMLRAVPPEPPAALLERILLETSGAAAQAPMVVHGTMQPGNVVPFRRPQVRAQWSIRSAMQSMMQPRLAMTAAMAFFSIALTLNLAGIHVTELRANDLKPSSIKRSYYQANEKVVRSIYNLRVVYELESRVRDLQRSGGDEEDGASHAKPEKKDGDGNKDDQQKHPAGEPRSPGKSSKGGTDWHAERRGEGLLAALTMGAGKIQREVRA